MSPGLVGAAVGAVEGGGLAGDELVAVVGHEGGRARRPLVRKPFETHYGSHQAVLADPDGNVFRINHHSVPDRAWRLIRVNK